MPYAAPYNDPRMKWYTASATTVFSETYDTYSYGDGEAEVENGDGGCEGKCCCGGDDDDVDANPDPSTSSDPRRGRDAIFDLSFRALMSRECLDDHELTVRKRPFGCRVVSGACSLYTGAVLHYSAIVNST
jgi:hypothetical protein